MKAIVYEKYGSADVLHLAEVPTPTPTDDQVLIKILAVSINGSDREGLVGKPLYARMRGLRRPGNRILGSDIAGRVEFVGKNNREFKVGDEVFGELPGYEGGFAEYACTDGKTMMVKPVSLTFEQAAAIPQGGVIAFNGIRLKGQVKQRQQVLINGGGGSAGSFAIQLAKLAGAEVTAVDTSGKRDFMRSLGADHLIDYEQEDFTKNGKQYDLILDLHAHRSAFALARALQPNGTYFVVGGSLASLLQVVLLNSWFRKTRNRNLRVLVVPQNRKDLIAITELCVSGRVIPPIDRVYPFDQVPEAMRYVAQGHANGKVVITVGP